MRTVIVVIYLILYYIFSIPAWIVGWVIGKINPDMKPRYAQTLIRRAFKDILFISGVKVTVKGQENILQGESAMYAFNHRSYFDILVGYTTGPMPLAFVSKDDLAHIPLITRWMKYMKCLFLDRNDIKKGLQTILEGIELLKSGHSVFIAPEGTRNHGEELIAEVNQVKNGPIWLKVEVDRLTRRFLYSYDGESWSEAGVLKDCIYLCDEGVPDDPKRHTGTLVGIYANNGGCGSRIPADFDFFEFQGRDINIYRKE